MIIVYFSLCCIFLSLILIIGFRLKTTLLATCQPRESEAGVERSSNFYGPMHRLLSEDDFRYLETRPEIPRSSVNRMRKERRRIFRTYLGCLATDFSGITTEIRSILVHSSVSRPDLATTLAKARIVFAFAMVSIEFRLLLHACGIHSLAMNSGRLTAALQQMQRELNSLSPAPRFSIHAV